MARDFKIELDNVEMINGSDDLLKDTKVTKVTLTGENKLNSLNSTFENCTELTAIEGEINLDGISDMTEMALNTTLDELKVTNPTEENIQTDNSLNQVTNVKIGGTKYSKGGVQDVVGSLEWNAENFTYEDTILDNVYTNSSSIEDNKNITVSDTLEQKATSIEITGQTYENLVNGKATENLLDKMSMQQTEGKPTQFTPHMEQPICLEYIEGETYQNLIEGKGEYKLTDTFSSTWTESNNSIENPPAIVEVPEIFGNTVQGYANVVTSKMIVDSINNSTWTDGNSAVLNPTDSKLYKVTSANSNNIDTNNISWIQLKANTTYSVIHYSKNYKIYFGTYVRCYENPSVVTSITSGKSFTTGSSGKVFLYPVGYQGQWNWIRCVEGQVDLSNYDYDEMDLNYIESVGDLYVDEGGEPILDEDGNEQYKLEIESTDNVNILDYELGYDIGLYNDDGTFDTSQTRSRTGKCYCRVKEGKRYIVYNNSGSGFGQWVKIYTFDENKNFIKKVFDSYEANAFYYTIPKGLNIKYIKLSIIDVWDKPHIIEDGKEIKFYGSGKGLSNKTTILLPQPLRRVVCSDMVSTSKKYDFSDKLYYDNVKCKYVIEKNIDEKKILSENLDLSGNISPHGNSNSDTYLFYLGKYSKWFENFMGNTVPIASFLGCAKTVNEVYLNTSTVEKWMFTPIASGSMLAIRIKKDKLSALTWDSFKAEILDKYEPRFIYILNTPQTIETKILEKPSLETYSPKTYISTNTEIQPSQMNITNKKVDFIPLGLQANKDYTLQLDSIGKNDKLITVNLGGTEATMQPINDTSKHHKVVVRTPSTLSTDKLDLSGEGVVVNDVMLFEGGSNEIKQDVEYVEGIQNIGELQEDGTYKIDISSNNGNRSFVTTNPNGWYLYNTNSYITKTPIKVKRGAKYTVKSRYGFWVVILESDSSGTIGGNVALKNVKEWSFVATSDYILVRTDHITTLDYLHEAQLRIFEGDVDCGYDGYENYISPQCSTQSILLPQPLNKIGNIKDKFYWDDNKGHYCIEQNINENLEVLDTPNIIDLPHLNKKYSLDTYMPTTYLECTNSSMQPSKLLLKSDTIRYDSIIKPNTLYTIQFNCLKETIAISTLNLGGTIIEVVPTIGLNHFTITTSNTLTSNELSIIDSDSRFIDVIVNEGEMNQYPKYFDGEQSVGELQDDGSYIIRISTDNYTSLWEGDL